MLTEQAILDRLREVVDCANRIHGSRTICSSSVTMRRSTRSSDEFFNSVGVMPPKIWV
jgi:hypothetical protein